MLHGHSEHKQAFITGRGPEDRAIGVDWRGGGAGGGERGSVSDALCSIYGLGKGLPGDKAPIKVMLWVFVIFFFISLMITAAFPY